MTNNNDEKYVVVKNGQRVGNTQPSKELAEAEAEKVRKQQPQSLTEDVKVKQVILG